MTFDQYRFEWCGSTYMQIFLIVNTIVLHDPLLVESMQVETQIQMNYRYGGPTIIYMQIFNYGEAPPNPKVVQGSTANTQHTHILLVLSLEKQKFPGLIYTHILPKESLLIVQVPPPPCSNP